MLSRRLAWLRYLPGLTKDFAQAQCLREYCDKPEASEQDGKREVRQRQEATLQGDYTLHYNPPSYHNSKWDSVASQGHTDNDEDEQCLSILAPSFRQQSNCYTVSSSRRLSNSKNTLLEIALNNVSEPETASLPQSHREPVPPDVKVDTRAFQKCRPEYASVTLDLTQRPPPIQWDQALLLLHKVTILKGNMQPSDVVHFLKELSRLHPENTPLVRSDTRFVMLLRYSVENLHHFTQCQLLDVLRSFVWLDLPSSHSILGLYEAELSRRASQMTFPQLLLVADLWRCIGRQVPQFLEHLYGSVSSCIGLMSISELVQLLYIMGEGRQCPADLVRPVEQLLMHHVHKLEPEEVGTVCLALFKSQTSISEGAVNQITDKAHSVVEKMSDFAMVNVLKLLRFSHLDHRAWLEAMAQEVPHRAHKMGVQGLMHVALACSALHYRNDCILMPVAERLPSLVSHCRSKDSCKLLWAFGTLGVLPSQIPGFYPSLIDSLRQKKSAFQRYPEHLLTGLLGLVFVSQFPEDLITLALSPEFIRVALKSPQLELKKDLFTLDETVALELPHWTGPRLVSELREEVAEMLWKYAQSDVCQKPEVVQAECALKDLLGGDQFVRKRMILPHTRSIDLEVHLDSTGQPVPVSNRNHHCYHSEQLLGLHAMKRRQLRLAGYRVVELSHWEWFPLLRKSRTEKLAYLHCKLSSSLE
uniref:FAST kinase domains 5 n=1 Tax=Myripristis murdjan TaxID=586833 RepID=A0A667Z6I4_9TELE